MWTRALAPGADEPDARSLNTQGIAALRRGERDGALATFARAVELFPEKAELHNNHGIVLLELGRYEEAAAAFERSVKLDPASPEALAHLGNAYAVQAKTRESLDAYQRALTLRPDFVEAHLAIYEVAQMQGDRLRALAHQRIALGMQRLYTQTAPAATARRSVLMLCTAGDWQANVPLEFVLDRATNTVHKYFLVDGFPEPIPELVPQYDVVFNAVAQSDETVTALEAVDRFIARQKKPFINDPGLVLESSRYTVWQKLSRVAGCFVARIYRRKRAACRAPELGRFLQNAHFELPILIRPVGSQAGHDLVKIDKLDQIDEYLDRVSSEEFYVSEFLDYRSADGYYRKYRIMFVGGVAYACHLAISENWMVHYYNTQMSQNAWMREEEARFLEDYRNVFGPEVWPALEEINGRMGLDYFGIDCTLTRDGRIFVFEADPAMVVHLSDSAELFPYKHKYVPRILSALEALLERKVAEGR